VRLRVYYFSREYPDYTGQTSIYDDTVSFQVAIPGEPLETGFVHVNDLHSLFGPGPYPGGDYLVLDRQYHLADLTEFGPRDVGLRATATNVSDNELGSGVAFEVICDSIDLDYGNLAEEDELAPGGVLCLNDDDDNGNGIPDKDDIGAVVGENDLVPVHISLNNPLYPGIVDFSVPSGGSRAKVYSNPDRSGLLSGTQYWQPEELPKTMYVEGVAPSSAPRDVTLRARRASCEDAVNVTVASPTKVPLGASLVSSGNPACYRAYVPTKWRGKLNIQTSAGSIADLAYPEATPYANNAETGENKHGWYTFKVVGAQSYTVSASFTQVGESTKRPWNFYWWSTNPRG